MRISAPGSGTCPGSASNAITLSVLVVSDDEASAKGSSTSAHRAFGARPSWLAKSIPGTIASTAALALALSPPPGFEPSTSTSTASALDQNAAYAHANSSAVIESPPATRSPTTPNPNRSRRLFCRVRFFSRDFFDGSDASSSTTNRGVSRSARKSRFPAGRTCSFRTLASAFLCAIAASLRLVPARPSNSSSS